MKVLLDHNLDRRLKNYLTNCEAVTTQEQGWADILNGELVALAETAGFDVLLTADKNIQYQQNIQNRRITIVILRAFNNRLATHTEMMTEVNELLTQTRRSEFVEILHPAVKEKLQRDANNTASC